MVTDNDAALVARVIGDDDRAAFELLVRRHQSPLRQFLRRLAANDAHLAEDLAQETFIKAYRSIATFRGSAKFSSWLYQIAYHTFLNEQRRRRPTAEFDDAAHVPDAPAPHAGEPVLERALRGLSIRQQAILDLHYRKDLTHQEVADALRLPLGTVKSDLTRAREQLRKDLGERNGE